MTLSPAGLAFLKKTEGFSPRLYPDAGGWAIGYGCQVVPTAWRGRTITEPDAESLLLTRVREFEAAVDTVAVPLEQHQYDALVCLAYNIGRRAFLDSTLARLLNQGDYAGAARQFPKWRYSQGKILNALVARRELEREMFLGERDGVDTSVAMSTGQLAELLPKVAVQIEEKET